MIRIDEYIWHYAEHTGGLLEGTVFSERRVEFAFCGASLYVRGDSGSSRFCVVCRNVKVTEVTPKTITFANTDDEVVVFTDVTPGKRERDLVPRSNPRIHAFVAKGRARGPDLDETVPHPDCPYSDGRCRGGCIGMCVNST